MAVTENENTEITENDIIEETVSGAEGTSDTEGTEETADAGNAEDPGKAGSVVKKGGKEAHWYVVHTYSGYEKKVKANIEMALENRNMKDRILEIRVPTQTVIETKDNGQRREVEKKLFPGYVLVKMILTDDSWYVVRNTRGVTGFVGPGGKAVPLTEKEIEHFGIESGSEAEPVTAMSFSVKEGDSVRISDGTMEGFVGTVKAIHADTLTADVSVSWFGRETIAEVELSKLAVVEEE